MEAKNKSVRVTMWRGAVGVGRSGLGPGDWAKSGAQWLAASGGSKVKQCSGVRTKPEKTSKGVVARGRPPVAPVLSSQTRTCCQLSLA